MLTALILSAGLAVKPPQYSKPPAVKVNINCGIPPIPPIGCRMVCSCDMRGLNCRWTAVCG